MLICFCKQIVHAVTKRNPYRFSVTQVSTNQYGEEESVEYKLCGAMFRRGELFVRGVNPYGPGHNVPPLPDYTKTGDNRVGMHHLGGLCPRHAFEFEKNLDYVLNLGDSEHSGDDPADPAVTQEDIEDETSNQSSPDIQNLKTTTTSQKPTPAVTSPAAKDPPSKSKPRRVNKPRAPTKKPPPTTAKRPSKARGSIRKPKPKKMPPRKSASESDDIKNNKRKRLGSVSSNDLL